VVTQNGPQIAVTILNGSPQLSMGEFLHAAGTAVAGAAMAKRAAGTARAAVQGGGKAVQAGVRGAQTIDAAFQGSTAAIEAAQKAAGNAHQEPAVWRGAWRPGRHYRERRKKHRRCSCYRTGEERRRHIAVGGGNSLDNKAKDNSRTHSDSEKAARSMGSKYGEEWARDNAPKAPEEPEKPAGVEGLKRD
jgi:hypothetical protein